MSTECWESNGFQRVLDELELGVLTLRLPELAERELAVPELGVRAQPLLLGVLELVLEVGVLALVEWGVLALPLE